MQAVSWDDLDYDGGLSPLTRYGTLNVSTARIPRKKRSRGNIAPARVRCVGTAMDDNGAPVLTEEGRATVKVTLADGTVEYRAASSFRKGRAERTSQTRPTSTREVSRDVALMAAMGTIHDPNDTN